MAEADLPFACATVNPETEGGVSRVPTDPGGGVGYAPDCLAGFVDVEPAG